MRTAFQRWHVPSGYRVVWSHRPPASRPEVALIREESELAAPSGMSQAPAELDVGDSASISAAYPPGPAQDHPGPPAEPASSEEQFAQAPGAPADPADDLLPAPTPVPAGGSHKLPIQDVLEHLNAQEAAERAQETPPAPAEAPARYRRSTWDFMDDDPFEEDPAYGLQRGRALRGAPSAASGPLDDPDKAGSPALGRGAAGERWRRARSAVRNFWSGPAEPKPALVIGLAMAVSVAVAVALALYSASSPAPGPPPGPPAASAVPGGEGAETGGGSDPFAGSDPYDSPVGGVEPQEELDSAASGEVAYVAASLLVCRAAPALEAPRVRNLLRGKEVRVLGYDSGWASVAYRGGQCWAQVQFLSPVPPL